MELNEMHSEHEHATTSLKVILLVFAIVLVGVLAYLVWAENTAPDTTDNSAAVVKTTATTDKNLVACGDTTKYGFDLTFDTVKWKGHTVSAYNGVPVRAIASCRFQMPTTSTDSITAVDPFNYPDGGHAIVFAVEIYTPAQWAIAKTEANPPTELGSNSSYVWTWSLAPTLPTDLQTSKIADDVKNVVATFKIAK